MDSCIGVEQDLDKAITKFTNLNEHTDEVLQDIINKVEELRREIAQRKLLHITCLLHFGLVIPNTDNAKMKNKLAT